MGAGGFVFEMNGHCLLVPPSAIIKLSRSLAVLSVTRHPPVHVHSSRPTPTTNPRLGKMAGVQVRQQFDAEPRRRVCLGKKKGCDDSVSRAALGPPNRRRGRCAARARLVHRRILQLLAWLASFVEYLPRRRRRERGLPTPFAVCRGGTRASGGRPASAPHPQRARGGNTSAPVPHTQPHAPCIARPSAA